MNLSDPDTWLVVVAAVAIIAVPAWLAIHVGGRLREMAVDAPDDPTLDLAEPINRIRMQMMIQNAGLHGSLNIRDGQVLPCPNAAGTKALSDHLWAGYANARPASGNENLMLAVYRDGEWVPTGVTLADLRDASICLEE